LATNLETGYVSQVAKAVNSILTLATEEKHAFAGVFNFYYIGDNSGQVDSYDYAQPYHPRFTVSAIRLYKAILQFGITAEDLRDYMSIKSKQPILDIWLMETPPKWGIRLSQAARKLNITRHKVAQVLELEVREGYPVSPNIKLDALQYAKLEGYAMSKQETVDMLMNRTRREQS